MYTITEIEDAIISTLKGSTMNSYCKKIDSYQIEGGDLEEQIRLFSLQMPCVLVIYSEGIYVRFPNKRLEREMKFSILVCSESLRGGGESRRGLIGAYKMLEDLKTVLTGQKLGLDIDPIFPVREAAEVNTKGFSAYSMEFITKCASTF